MATDLSSQLRDIILNTHVPLVLPDFPINWECFDDSLQHWCTRYDQDASLGSLPAFESMDVTDCETPQWERKRKHVKMSMQKFLHNFTMTADKQPKEWAAYQYVRAHDIPPSCLSGIDFKCFGFAEHQNDYSLWLGSKGANTPCHYDTYGVNIVVQAYGSKSWLLFPPETPLQSTRIPYEESSVYCLENFYAPAPDKLQYYEQFQEHAYHCLLQPGDVLIVPRQWWHYVEAVSTSLSVNYWVPLKSDLDLTFDELLVKHVVESFVKGESNQLKQYLLNPNQLGEIAESASSLFSQFEHAVLKPSLDNKRKLWDTDYLTESEVLELLRSVRVCIRTLDVMPKEAYTQLITDNAKRHTQDRPGRKEDAIISSTLEQLINSMCAPRCIASIKQEFFRRMKQMIDYRAKTERLL
ncbi:PREDICTED: HSPB1-associated protein 1 [Drosophila arizonae]|uniref:HSPB1-associated protein 1 n=1 Tax=Drosophila arizonae TaxID=7263 RepID=A0ABM1Q153_DROAR|nr:PREDICTED: HSPB1-associated protein 1 [Drosophila arizonae]